MNRAPAFQFYPKDWLDFRVQRMSLAAQGAYLKVLCFMWKDSQDQCSIIDDDRAIATAIGVPCEIWKELRNEIQFPGDPILKEEEKERPLLRSCRLQREAEKQRNYAIQQAEKGKRGAIKRWQKDDSHSHSSGHAPAIAQGMANDSSSFSSPLKELNKADVPVQERNIPTSIAPANQKKKQVLRPLPDGFVVSDDVWAWTALKEFPRKWVETEFEHFCQRSLSKDERFANWDAAFRKWLLKAKEYAATPSNGHHPRPNNGLHNRQRERIPL